MASKQSEWRDDEAWAARLERDQATLRETLSEEQIEALDMVVREFAADDQIKLSFVVVFGSQATGEAHEESDLDIYAEANVPKARGFSIPRAVDFLINPNGTLITGADLGFEMNSDVIRQARIWHDGGAFRDLLVGRDEDQKD